MLVNVTGRAGKATTSMPPNYTSCALKVNNFFEKRMQGFGLKIFVVTFSAIFWPNHDKMVEEIGVPKENHLQNLSHWQLCYTPEAGFKSRQFSCERQPALSERSVRKEAKVTSLHNQYLDKRFTSGATTWFETYGNILIILIEQYLEKYLNERYFACYAYAYFCIQHVVFKVVRRCVHSWYVWVVFSICTCP